MGKHMPNIIAKTSLSHLIDSVLRKMRLSCSFCRAESTGAKPFSGLGVEEDRKESLWSAPRGTVLLITNHIQPLKNTAQGLGILDISCKCHLFS